LRTSLRIGLALAAVLVAPGADAPPAALGAPVGLAESIPTHCGVESLAAGHEGNVWFTCLIETDYGYGSRVRVGRVTPGGSVAEFGGGLPKNREPGQIVTAADGDLWFPLSSLYLVLHGKRQPPELARVTPGGEVTTYPTGLSAGYDIDDIVASPSGYLWFSAARYEDGKEPSLWQVSPRGTISRLPIELAADASVRLEVGPEGDLWLAKKPASGPAAAAIARFDPSGALSEFGAGIPGFAPGTPLLAADGSGWFFSGASGIVAPTGVGRIDAAGTITDTGAKLQTGGGIVGGSTIGPEGNLWFGFQSGSLGHSAIERVTAAGQVTEFRDCLRYSQPFFGPASLVTGGDGNVWFTSIASRELPGITDPPSIGRITPSGEIAQIYAGVDLEPSWILAGADGAIWFSAGIDEIQRIAPIEGPINTFRVAPLRRAAAGGRATARVVVAGPGELRLKPLALLLPHHRRVRLHGGAVSGSSGGCGAARLPVKPVGAALRRFRQRREASERVAVTFTPRGGTPHTETAKLYFYAPRPHRHRG
jgi:streptogramin lyase